MASKASKAATLDLDALEAEGTSDPFTVKLGGRVVTLADPKDLDYKVLLGLMTDPSQFLDVVVLDAADRAHVAGEQVSLRKLTALIEGYMTHYGMEMPKGESRASSRR